MAKISACVITKNEAQNIERCLQSVRSIVNEIIVVDTGSTDATVMIAEQLGAKIFHYQWSNDFAAARNYALAQASGAWVVFLDADEYIAVGTVKNVRPLIEKIHGNRKIEAVKCQMNNLEGIDGPVRSSNPTIRIFRNSPLIRYRGRIHEAVYKGGKPLKPIEVTNRLLTVCHTGYTNSTILEKVRRNTALLEEELASGGVRTLTYCYLSDGYWRSGEYEKSIEFAKQAIKQMKGLRTEFDYKPYVFLISSMTRLKTYQEDEVTASCQEAVARFHHHPEIWLFQGIYFQSIGRCEEALASLLKALALNDTYCDFNRNNDFPGLSPDAYFAIAQIYEMKNQPAKALDYYAKVLQRNKLKKEAFHGLVSLIREQEPADVIYFLNMIYDTASEADIRFLVTNLSELKVKKVLDFYHHILRDTFNDKTLNALVLLTNCSLETVLPVLIDAGRKQGGYTVELLAVAALIVNDCSERTEVLGPNVNPSLKNILALYFQPDSAAQLGNGDLPVFCDLVGELLYLGSQQQMQKILEMGKRFYLSNNCFTRISTLLLHQRFFGYTLDMILNYVNQVHLESKQLSLLYCDAGYCCYRLKDFAGAARYFEQALELGDRRHYIFDFLDWSYQQCREQAIKEKFKILKELYSI
ncbi:glycosyltransferase [Sporomusa aerivorans]|uniref:glycosyltransferase n=1 Tax=Sporomusa aerivorans TaxID=204936 RepID=UPI00352A4EF3